MFSLQVLGAVAQLERALISERTKAGIAAAKAKGRLPGNPGIRERRPEMLSKMKLAQKAAYFGRLQATGEVAPCGEVDDLGRHGRHVASEKVAAAAAGASTDDTCRRDPFLQSRAHAARNRQSTRTAA